MTIGLKAANAGKALMVDQELETIVNYYSEIENSDTSDDTQSNVRKLPCVICFATSIENYPTGTKLSNLNLHFKIVASADDMTDAQFDAMFEEVHDTINTASVCENLSNVQEDFHAFGFWGDVQESDLRTEGRNRVKEIILPINCCPYDVE